MVSYPYISRLVNRLFLIAIVAGGTIGCSDSHNDAMSSVMPDNQIQVWDRRLQLVDHLNDFLALI